MRSLESGEIHDHNEKQRSPRMRLTPDEIRVLKECNRDSFYYRSVPISTVAMIATHYAVKLGYLRPNPKWGSLVKVIGAGVLGYFVGKVSYRTRCEEKLMMEIPNSHLAELLRRRKQGLPAFPEIYTMDPSYASTSGSGDETSAHRNNFGLGGQGTWEIDSDRNVEYQGLDDSHRPSLDNPMQTSESDQRTKTETTYEALRRQNRENFEARRSNCYGRKEQQQRSSVDQKQPSVRTESSSYSGVRNKYGDSME